MSLAESGFFLIENFLTHNQLIALNSHIDELGGSASAGIRQAEKKFEAINELIQAEKTQQLAQDLLTTHVQMVRCILFDKTSANNWLVSWHQDKTLCTPWKFEREGWGPWSIKDGVQHVQPPGEVLDQVITLRFHLDDTDSDNGCLKVLPASHKLGILSAAEINLLSKKISPISCEGKKGSIMIMKPLLVHSSSKALKPGRRRVIHVEFAPKGLVEID